MPKSITIETDPSELAALLQTNADVKNALLGVLKSAKITMPESEVSRIASKIESKIGATAMPSAQEIADAALASLAKSTTPKAVSAVTKSRLASKASSSDPVMKFLYANCAPGLEVVHGKQNVRLCGPAGSAKTHRAREFANEAGFDHVIEVHCMSDMEPRDLIAGPTPGEQTDGGFRAPFVDGKLAKAQRLAAKGETVCIILDELGNMPKSAKQAFQSWLSPFGARGSEMCKLITGRAIEAMDADGNLLKRGDKGYHEPYIEEIDAPFKNITIIGTQNVGAEYDCPEDSPAIIARLMAYHVETDAKLVRTVCEPIMTKEFGWSGANAKHVSKCLQSLLKGTINAKDKSLLSREISLREYLVVLSKISHVSDNLEAIMTNLMETLKSDGISTWCVANGHDGRPMKEQIRTWVDLVNSHCDLPTPTKEK